MKQQPTNEETKISPTQRWFMNRLDNMWGDEVQFIGNIARFIPFIGKSIKATVDLHWAERVAREDEYARRVFEEDTP